MKKTNKQRNGDNNISRVDRNFGRQPLGGN